MIKTCFRTAKWERFPFVGGGGQFYALDIILKFIYLMKFYLLHFISMMPKYDIHLECILHVDFYRLCI